MSRPLQRAAALLDDLKRPALAEQELRRALAENPDDAYAHAMLAHYLGQQGRFKDADAAIADAIRLSPDYGYAHRIRGWLLWRRDDWRGAESAYREALRLDPADVDAYQGLSALLSNLGQAKEGLAVADQGLARYAEDVLCLNRRALALLNLGRFDEAQAAVDAALRVNPLHAVSHQTQAWIHRRRLKTLPAVESYRRALNLDPADADGSIRRDLRTLLVEEIGIRFLMAVGLALTAATAAMLILARKGEGHPALRPLFGVMAVVALPAALGLFYRPLKYATLSYLSWGRDAVTPAEAQFGRRVARGCVVYSLAAAAIWIAWPDVIGALTATMILMTVALPVLAIQPGMSARQRLGRAGIRVLILAVFSFFAFLGFADEQPVGLGSFLFGFCMAVMVDCCFER